MSDQETAQRLLTLYAEPLASLAYLQEFLQRVADGDNPGDASDEDVHLILERAAAHLYDHSKWVGTLKGLDIHCTLFLSEKVAPIRSRGHLRIVK